MNVLTTAVFVFVGLCYIRYCTSQEDTGAGILYKLSVVQDVLLERPNQNYNYLDYLITAFHQGYPKKRSLLQFEDLPQECKSVTWAKMYVRYSYSHKASGQSILDAPFISRPTEVYQVNQSWIDSEATSAIRKTGEDWNTPYLDITGYDAGPELLDTVTIFSYHPGSTFKEFDITAAVINWKKGEPNYGVLMLASNEDDDGRDTRWFSDKKTDKSLHAFVNVLCAQTCEDIQCQCPFPYPTVPHLLPHPTTCERYCKCDDTGDIHDIPCPCGTLFNAELKLCVWPFMSGCDMD